MIGASGLRSEFFGLTDEISSAADDHDHDILIQVVGHQATELLSMGEWGRTSLARDGAHWTAATVSLSAEGDGVLDAPDAPFSWATLTMHEVGHALGLAHSSDTSSLMFADLSLAASSISTADRASLLERPSTDAPPCPAHDDV